MGALPIAPPSLRAGFSPASKDHALALASAIATHDGGRTYSQLVSLIDGEDFDGLNVFIDRELRAAKGAAHELWERLAAVVGDAALPTTLHQFDADRAFDA